MANPTPNTALGPSFLDQVPVEITVSVGQARPLLRDLLGMEQGAILSLDRKLDDPVELFIGDRLIARGALQEVENNPGQIAVRLTEILDTRAAG
ncbi:flagellar motor switch protein FliN/FliY [Rhodovulum bhavnagarense]|uniref:Flagellar motor switch protein FliN n=1 Tax=Rhodovulum bhavnagarense TaxID=992286 RepID=A0A4R2REZ7_9RHOB|nr:FliM/FliN family flagellar motor switch protein [Rhodovulum bhavnagarense]TCP61174.1 flagellar motor switch protein FliN/FliY [Rhodovulum bhavnagarense]